MDNSERYVETIKYSRGIPSKVVKEIKGKEIICEMIEYIKKYILRDDVIDWERDVLRYEPKQLKMNYIMCDS